jgi:catechol 2,3-dioxygenase-like lactoylglutathione lyase family enzyme
MRRLHRILSALVLGGGVVLAIAPSARGEVLELRAIGLTVADLGRTERFYRDGLGFRTVRREGAGDAATARLLGVENALSGRLTMRLGEEQVEFLRFRRPGRPYPRDSRSPDLWFQHFAVVVADMDAAHARLRRIGFTPITVGGPQTLPEENGRVRAFKFRDPDGHPLELLQFPPGQGRAVWQERARGGALFLGIDHSAIGVSATPASLAFYRDVLGMRVLYETTNRGPAQEKLDGTFNAVVRITGLRPASAAGPGVEFLDYRTPPTGRRPRANASADDVAHARLALRVADLSQLPPALEAAGARLASPGAVALPGGGCAAQVLDPDAHALVLEQSEGCEPAVVAASVAAAPRERDGRSGRWPVSDSRRRRAGWEQERQGDARTRTHRDP